MMNFEEVKKYWGTSRIQMIQGSSISPAVIDVVDATLKTRCVGLLSVARAEDDCCRTGEVIVGKRTFITPCSGSHGNEVSG